MVPRSREPGLPLHARNTCLNPRRRSGFYSTVYCGTWQNQAVAIKQLNENASKRVRSDIIPHSP